MDDRSTPSLPGKANGTRKFTHDYPLRGTMHCAECSCLITAGTHEGYIYYRCTHDKTKGQCSQNAYIPEDRLTKEMDELLARIEITPETLEQLVADATDYSNSSERAQDGGKHLIEKELAAAKAKEDKLLEGYLAGAVPVDVYREKAEKLASARKGLELRVAEYGRETLRTSEEVRALASVAAGARVAFNEANGTQKREIIQTVLCNLDVKDGHIASHQYKDPFRVLEMDSKGAFYSLWSG